LFDPSFFSSAQDAPIEQQQSFFPINLPLACSHPYPKKQAPTRTSEHDMPSGLIYASMMAVVAVVV
jgi:hypothetical protein